MASVTQPAERSFRICYSKAGAAFDLSASNRIAFLGILNKPDSLLLRPIADSAYFFAFKDIDSKYILIYQTAYVPNDAFGAHGCQIFKEGLGLLYERYYNGDPWHGDSKLALLKKIDDSSIDVIPIISRIMGMQDKCAAAVRNDSIVLSIHGSLFDSIQGKKAWDAPTLLSIKSDTNLLFAPNFISQLYLFSPDTIITVGIGFFDTISISGYTYSPVNRIPYAFGGW